MQTPGQILRGYRDELGYTVRDVEAASLRIAARHGDDDFAIPISRLFDIESKGVTPSIYRLYTLSILYRRDMRELLALYGIDLTDTTADYFLAEPPKSHTTEHFTLETFTEVPAMLDPAFDPGRTTNLGRMVQQWAIVPFSRLAALSPEKLLYGYIGSEDLTMYPLLLPGSFIQVDETKNKVQEGGWRSELERPVYFVETRNGFVCCWCSLRDDELVLQPHPLSPVAPRILRNGSQAEVLGQVVGVAMRLGDWTNSKETKPIPRAKHQGNGHT